MNMDRRAELSSSIKRNYDWGIFTGSVIFVCGVIVLIFCLRIVNGYIKQEESVYLCKRELIELQKFNFDGPYFSYSDPQAGITSAAGVDVSAHQGYIDWNCVKEAGIEFAMLRLGYRGYENGVILLDDFFADNLSRAKEAGLAVGVYFYSQALNEEEAKEEAAFVLENLKGIELDYPVAYDFEFPNVPDARTAGMEWEQVSENAGIFCRLVQSAGYEPMLYAGMSTYYIYSGQEELEGIAVWYPEYRTKQPEITDFTMWQYTDCAEVSGIDTGPVDLNVMLYKEGS